MEVQTNIRALEISLGRERWMTTMMMTMTDLVLLTMDQSNHK
jgi:hypothetical protein